MSDKTKELEVTPELAKEIGKAVSDGLLPELEKSIDSKIESKIEAIEPKIQKQIADPDKKDKKLPFAPAGKLFSTPMKELPKQQRLLVALKAYANKDYAKMDEYNERSFEMWREKGNEMDTLTDADGGYLVPDPELVADISRLTANYGVAFRDATVRTVRGNSVKLNKLVSDVTLFETAEQGNIQGTKLTLAQKEITLVKYAGNAIISRELEEDSAVDIYDAVVDSFARARAKKADEITFTHATQGILNTAGVFAIGWGTNLADMTADALLQAEDELVEDARVGAKYYMHRKVVGVSRRLKDAVNGQYLFAPATQGQAPTINGYPFERVEVMPSVNTANEPFVVFGNLKYYVLVQKRGLRIELLTEGIVLDAGGSDVNLAKTDQFAVKCTTRLAGGVVQPSAFVLIGTGTVSA